MDAQSLFDKGVSKVKTAVSAVSIEQRDFVKAFVHMCDDGWQQGWHERNGGNASYRLTPAEATACRSFFLDPTTTSWVPLGITAPNLAGECFLVTAAGSFMRNVAVAPSVNIGIVEIDAAGAAYRIAWGFGHSAGEADAGGAPTSEFVGHMMVHAVKKATAGDACRVLYHCHPTDVAALSFVVGADARALSRTLWKCHTECCMVFPEGVGAVPFEVPGSLELADKTAAQMEAHNAVIWVGHGLMVASATCDEAFGLAHVIVKAAGIYRAARTMSAEAQFIPDDELNRIASGLGVALNPAYQ